MIGIFDSGSGGLTVLRAMKDVLPSCDVVYFGDIKNAPYGSKTPEELSTLTVHALQLLQAQGATSIVSACNSVSASLAVSLFDALDIAPMQLIEMVGPTVSHFKNSSTRIALCATPATIRSGVYQNAFRMIGKDIVAVSVPDLAPAIEFGKSEDEMRALLKTAFENIDFSNVDVLVLACTHYPLVTKLFKEIIPSSVSIVDPALAVAARVEKWFWPREAGKGSMRFLISKDSAPFRALVAKLFPQENYSIEVLQ
jgi:glutamate racemase